MWLAVALQIGIDLLFNKDLVLKSKFIYHKTKKGKKKTIAMFLLNLRYFTFTINLKKIGFLASLILRTYLS